MKSILNFLSEEEIAAINAADYVDPNKPRMIFYSISEVEAAMDDETSSKIIPFPCIDWDWDPNDPAAGMAA